MRYDRSTRPPQVAALLEQIAATDARIAQLDRELAVIHAGRLLDAPTGARSTLRTRLLTYRLPPWSGPRT